MVFFMVANRGPDGWFIAKLGDLVDTHLSRDVKCIVKTDQEPIFIKAREAVFMGSCTKPMHIYLSPDVKCMHVQTKKMDRKELKQEEPKLMLNESFYNRPYSRPLYHLSTNRVPSIVLINATI